MDCKNALNETGGDLEAAIDWLRKKGLAKAAKKAGRVAAEGLVAVESSGPSRGDPGGQLRDRLRRPQRPVPGLRPRSGQDRAHGRRRRSRRLEAAHFPGSQTTVKDRLQELIATIGENMTLRRARQARGLAGRHRDLRAQRGQRGPRQDRRARGAGIGRRRRRRSAPLGRQIAMHVAATNPLALDASGIDPATVERESAILREKNAGKPDHVLQKIVESGLKSYYKEVTLLEQAFVHDPSKIGRPGPQGGRSEGRQAGRRSRASCAMPSARASRRKTARISRPRSPPRPAQGLMVLENGSAAIGQPRGNRSFEPPLQGCSCAGCQHDRETSAVPVIPFRRVLVKLSGEALMAPDGYWLDPQTLSGLAAGSRRARPAPGSRSRWSSAAATSSAAPA